MLMPVAFGQQVTRPPVVCQKRVKFGFGFDVQELVTIYTFHLNGSVHITDNQGSDFYIPPPKFQPVGPVTVDLVYNQTHVTHSFDVDAGTLKLWVSYHMAGGQEVKVTMNGTTTDPDAEVEFEFENPKGLPQRDGDTFIKIGGVRYDWADLEGATDFDYALNKLKVKFDYAFSLDPYVVGEGQDQTATRHGRKVRRANGFWWVFYYNGSRIVYRSSEGGGSWRNETDVCDATDGDAFSIYVNGTQFDYACESSGAMNYRRGTFNSLGFIDWTTTEQVAVASSTGDAPTIACDSQNIPFIAYMTGANQYNVTKSSLSNGTWSTDSGYPQVLQVGSGHQHGQLVSLSGQKMYVVHTASDGDAPLNGTLYNGTAWETSEQVSTTDVFASRGISAVADGDSVYAVFGNVTDYGVSAIFMNRTYGVGWGSEVSLDITCRGYPEVGLGGSNCLGQVYVFGLVGRDAIYYQAFNGSWGDAVRIPIPELISAGTLQVTYEQTGNWIGLAYTTTDNVVMFDVMGIGTVPPEHDPHGGGQDGDQEGFDLGDFELPPWGLWLIGGSLAVIGVGSALKMKPRRAKSRGPAKTKRMSTGPSRLKHPSRGPPSQKVGRHRTPAKSFKSKGPKRNKRTGRFA